jgi:flagellar basal-body rod protein FlgB
MSDLSIGILQYGLDSLSLAQQAAANNIANLDTPGYTAEEVNFQASLEQALAQGQGSPTASAQVYASTAPPGPNGNNVDVTQEISNLQQDVLQYQTLVNALNAKFQQIYAAENTNF